MRRSLGGVSKSDVGEDRLCLCKDEEIQVLWLEDLHEITKLRARQSKSRENLSA